METPAVLLLLLSFAFLLETSNEAVLSGLSASLQEAVDKWIAKKPAGAVVASVVAPDSTEYFFGGKLAPNNQALPTKYTMFEIGSITKGFTGLLLADQVLSGIVHLNDTLSKLLTDWPGRFSSPAGSVTLLELTTHSSGLPRLPANFWPTKDPNNPYAAYTVEKLYKWLDSATLSNRSSYLYSNAGVGILGHALATAAGQKYEDLLKKRILAPLVVFTDTTITVDSDQKSRTAPGHNENGSLVTNWDFVLAACGALRSSPFNLAVFLRLVTGLNDNEQIRKPLEFATQRLGKAYDYQSTTIGCNWFRSLLPQNKLMIHHSGATGGYDSFVGWVPELQTGVLVLASVTYASPAAEDLALELLGLKLKL